MNRYLMAGCAAVALAMGTGAANAQAKFEVRIGGDAYFEAGYVDQDLDAGERDLEFRNRFRLNIVPSAKADNGLEYGGRLRVRSQSSGAGENNFETDRALIFVAGSFGRVELGQRNSYNDDSYVSRPIDFHFLGIVDAAVSFAGSPAAGSLAELALTENANATKIVYLSPRFSGFQLGASYTPRNDSQNTEIDRSENVSSYQDIFEIGFNYKGEFSGVSVAASGAYQGGEAESPVGTTREDLSAWQLGAQIGYAGFVLGGGYTNRGESGLATTAAFKDDQEVWAVGLQYTSGPIIAGFGYTHGSDAGSATLRGEREQDYYTVGVSYTVAPGLSVGLEYNYIDVDVEEVGGAEDESSVVIARSVLRF